MNNEEMEVFLKTCDDIGRQIYEVFISFMHLSRSEKYQVMSKIKSESMLVIMQAWMEV
jgi:phosphosulfolactate synthase (CoM biosynthesis protein A)